MLGTLSCYDSGTPPLPPEKNATLLVIMVNLTLLKQSQVGTLCVGWRGFYMFMGERSRRHGVPRDYGVIYCRL